MHTLATFLGPAALATKEFRSSTNPEDGVYVKIVGRKSGIIDWVLSLIGVDSTTTFEVMRDHIRFTTANFSGAMTTFIPMHSIANTSTGYFKPVLYLIIGIITLPVFFVGLIPIIYYFLHKTLMISTQDNSGFATLIAFKPSVIEGLKIGPKDAQKVVGIINKLVLISNQAKKG